MTAPERCCADVAAHCHDGKLFKDGRPYAYRFAFEWRRPRFVLVRTGVNPAPLFVLNRYPGVVIGFAVRIRGNRALSVLWGRPGRVIEMPAAR